MSNVSVSDVWPGLDFSWVPSDLSALSYDNCTSVSLWEANVITLASVELVDLPILLTVEVFRDGLTEWLGERNITQPADKELYAYIYWDYYWGEQALWNTIGSYAETECLPELCPLLRWQGNSDLAGRGMLVNYIIQASLATIYLVILAAIRLDRIVPRENDRSFLSRGVIAVHQTARPFLDAAIFFCLAMLLAALYTFARGYDDDTNYLTTYSAITTALLSIYSAIPAILIHACISNQHRRKKWRIFVWGLIAALAIVVAALYLYMPSRAKKMTEQELENIMFNSPDRQFFWDSGCLNRGAVAQMDIGIKVLVGALFGSTLLYVVFALSYHRFQPERLSPMRSYWWLFTALFCLLGMWVCLGMFIYLRRVMNANSGNSNKDHEWSFGQVLGLVTWAPVLVELAYIWKYGPRDGLTGQMISPYLAVHEADTLKHEEALSELVPRGYERVHGE
ncbi:hypothetical protein EJ04DRAFT_564385 [Polyplosphaeria fusca]|uniref:Uncharacterized protein n=1 Tax=Polyplosphaeria fusca TaxID=682080 RepID=A0A9P4QXF2_9PLEO|nr:hypothetical protein EJ04DRAFT_564385 [Polyplosphaeria fusca]